MRSSEFAESQPVGFASLYPPYRAQATLASLYRGDVREKLKALSLAVRADRPQVVRRRIAEAVVRWGEVIEKSGIKSE